MKKRMCIWLYLYGLIKWDGVNVMTIHKSKGKEFDVVIVYEGRYRGHIISQSRQNRSSSTKFESCRHQSKEVRINFNARRESVSVTVIAK